MCRRTAPSTESATANHTQPCAGSRFGQWLLEDGEAEAQTVLVACPRSPKFLVQLELECSSPGFQSNNLSTHTTVESSYYWSNICSRPVRLAALASKLGTGGTGVVQDLLKHLSFIATVTLSEHLGTGLGAGSPGGKKANGATATEQMAALTFTVTGKP